VLSARALDGLPEIAPGDDLATLIVEALQGRELEHGHILVLAHKVVSKSEGRIRRLSEIEPSDEARRLAPLLGHPAPGEKRRAERRDGEPKSGNGATSPDSADRTQRPVSTPK